MRRFKGSAWAVTAAISVALVAVPGDAAGAKRSPRPATTLKSLVKKTVALPPAAAKRGQRRSLRRSARHARRVQRRRPCVAVRDLARYRRVLGRVRVRKGRRGRRAARRVVALGPLSVVASRGLLARRATRRCGGGVKAPTRRNTAARVLSSDMNGMRLRVRLAGLRFVGEQGGGRAWTRLVLPNTDSPGAPGRPGIPRWSSTFAIPEGAELSVDAGSVRSYTLDGVEVFPVQRDPVDQEQPAPDFTKAPFATPPFTLNTSAYAARGPVPAEPADGLVLGRARDVTVGALHVPAAQYDPARERLRVLTSVDVTVRFVGGPHTFSDELSSPWEQSQRRLGAALLNGALFGRNVREILRRCGEEMLVITNPATRPAADTFAAARRGAGIRTTIVETGTATGQIGTTAAQIQTFIRGRLTRFGCIRPSYVTILGDDDLVPTFAILNGIPSDLPYSMRDEADELPDVAVGRIIGNDQAAVGTAVQKIVEYENGPPGGPWLRRALMAAQFQDDDLDGRENRTFITFAETVRNGLAGQGVAVDRIYDDSPTATPTQFNDGTALPAALQKPTFAWDGDGADVSGAWNEGRFLVMHRDHGWSDGWGHPSFTTTDAQALTNGDMLPIVMSINCSSGAYDYDETSFAGESLVDPGGGSVGVFGDTRDSPSWHNTQIALGFVDGLLPPVLPAEGPAMRQRTGDALITGKLRLAGLAPPATDGNTRNELHLWHFFGDPSMQMWGGTPPRVFDPALFDAVLVREARPGPDPPPYLVTVTLPPELSGQTVSLLRNGEVVGKAVADAGKATIPATFGDGSPKPGELQVALDPDGAEPIRVPVTVPPEPPPPPPAQTTITQECPDPGTTNTSDQLTVTGTLTGAPGGSTVEVTFENPDTNPNPNPRGFVVTGPRTIVVQAQTDADGNFQASVDPNDDETGEWRIRSRFAGSPGYAPSDAGECAAQVHSP